MSVVARFGRALLLLVALLVCSRPATSQLFGAIEDEVTGDKPFELTADSLEFESERNLYVAEGNVRIDRGETWLRADWVAFNDQTGAAVASGAVELVDRGDTLRAEFVEFNIFNLQGVIYDAWLDSEDSQFRMQGMEIHKTGDRTYKFRHGTFTTCRCPDEDDRVPWRIRAEKAQLEVEGYGTARNTTFDVLGVPVVWLPWAVYPIKTERQTGFLFPKLGIGGRNGFEFGLPFFWAAHEQLNVTLTPRWLTKRGPKADVELEYVLGEESSGEIFAAFLHDDDIDPDSENEPYDRERWATKGEQDLFLPLGMRLQADWAFVSDNDYPLDFEELDDRRADRFLQSVGFATRHLGDAGRFGAVGSMWWADDLQNPDDQDRDRFLLQRAPDLTLAALPGPLAWTRHVVPSFDLDYTSFQARKRASGRLNESPTQKLKGQFLDVGIDAVPDADERGRPPDPNRDNFDPVGNPGGQENNGRFDEGEPIQDRGHRIRLRPRLAVPFQVADVVEVYPEASWYQTLYSTREQDFDSRGLFTGRVDARSRLRRRYGKGRVGALDHLLEPRIGWALVTEASQGDNPLFVPETAVPQARIRALDLDNVTRDPADRIDDANLLSFGLGNRLYENDEEGRSVLRADFTLLGGYEIADNDLGWTLDARLYPFEGATARASFSYDLHQQRVEEFWSQLNIRHPDGHLLSLDYRYLRRIPLFFEDFQNGGDRFDNVREFDEISQLSGNVQIAITPQWRIGYRGAYSFEQSLMLANRGFFEYTSSCRCWAAGLEFIEDRTQGLQVRLMYRLVGLGTDVQFGGAESGFLDSL